MIKVRKACLKDIPTIMEMWKEFMRYHDEILIKKNPDLKPHLIQKKNAENEFKKFARKSIRSKNFIIHIMEVGGKPAGYSLSYIKENVPFYTLGKIGYISDLFVRKEFRGMRISSRLKDEAIKWFKKKRMKYISVGVYQDNKFAHSIYEKWGFFDYHIDMRRKT